MMRHQLVIPTSHFPSLIDADSANNYNPTTLFGTAHHVKTVSTAKAETTPMTPALTPMPSVSPSQNC